MAPSHTLILLFICLATIYGIQAASSTVMTTATSQTDSSPAVTSQDVTTQGANTDTTQSGGTMSTEGSGSSTIYESVVLLVASFLMATILHL